MKNNNSKHIGFFNKLIYLFLIFFIFLEPVFAGPGGKIARAVFETFWGKILLGVLAVVLLPLIIYVSLKEKLAERRARKELKFMSSHSSIFDWLKIQERVKDCFYRVHRSWSDEDLSNVQEWMTNWYWQNQQMVFLDNWKKENLINICNVKSISDIKPLLFSHRNDPVEHEDSMIVVSITANMQDYLKNRENDEIVEGSKNYKDVETVWTFTLEKGSWKVSDIEEGSMSLVYAKAYKDVPAVETTLMEKA